jgi:hypothetical protein
MDRSLDYLCRAEEAVQKAAKAHDAKTKLQFLDLADTWRNLAHQAGGLRGPPTPDSRR